jgi:hypothetical protein
MQRLAASPLVARALAVAEKHLGTEELCRRLVAPETMIRAWGIGHTTMPEHKFLRLVDILTELDPSWVEWDELKPRG